MSRGHLSECKFQWESVEPCQLPFHRCGCYKGHKFAHRCVCGEELKLGAAWEIASSIDLRTGRRRTPAPKGTS